MVIPLSVSPHWLSCFYKGRSESLSFDEAAAAASLACGVNVKEFARCRISTGSLSVPVVGGADVLKKRHALPLLSEHGKWRREHLGAWNAAYGRSPFFIHLFPLLQQIYLASEGKSLEDFNRELLMLALSWLDFEAVDHDKERLRPLAPSLLPPLNEDLSVFDALFRFGPDAVFRLFPW